MPLKQIWTSEDGISIFEYHADWMKDHPSPCDVAFSQATTTLQQEPSGNNRKPHPALMFLEDKMRELLDSVLGPISLSRDVGSSVDGGIYADLSFFQRWRLGVRITGNDGKPTQPQQGKEG